MAARQRTETHKHITVWLEKDVLARMDEHLAREVSRVPGARISRHRWLAHLVQEALAAASSPPVPQ